MSDDEFIYDDDDDWYWYEEDNMGLGDELAENAVYSPIMVEDPSLETVDTYSDWEYYSDDYYDDDPTIMTKHNTNGEPRKKRRKLSSVENIPRLSLGSSIVDSSTSMANSFKGVLWRVPVKTDEKIELYEPGKGEQVALLSDWRELFKTPMHISNGAGTDGNGTKSDAKPDVSAVRAKERESVYFENGIDTEYGRYSPPPLAIEDLDRTICRQREKVSQSELQTAPENGTAEMMIVADSDDEELNETEETTIAVPEIDDVEDDKENMVMSEREDRPSRQTSIRVEIPTLAAAMKEDSLEQNTPSRKRGRQSKSATTETSSTNGNNTSNKAATAQTSTRGRKRALEDEKEDEEPQDDNTRRSKRVASSTVNKPPKDTETDKKRTRANSTTAPKVERGKRRKV